jgi:hypothetical protein
MTPENFPKIIKISLFENKKTSRGFFFPSI